MEQHPIPQQIASYQFKLVGDMTLKQFTQLAGGALISLLLYASPLHPFIKWPLIIISFLFGVALAFLPIQDRPLSTWIFVFFRSIYSPTYFVWNKSKKPSEYFMPEEVSAKPASIKIAEKKETVEELLQPVVKQTSVTEKLEEKEKSYLTKLTQSFIAPNTTVVISTTPIHTFIQPAPLKQAPQATATISVAGSIAAPETQEQRRPTVFIPGITQVGTGKPVGFQTPQTPRPSPQQITGNTPGDTTVNIIPQSYQKIDVQKGVLSQFSKDVMPPLPATRENVVVGQVLDPYGQIIEGAILEIKEPEGRPVRALRSNRLGHFMIATPLIAGKYIIQTEKDGYEFEPYKFKVEDKIIPPIAIWAIKGGVKNEEPVQVKSNPNEDFLKDYKL
jgi:hypothetical protein